MVAIVVLRDVLSFMGNMRGVGMRGGPVCGGAGSGRLGLSRIAAVIDCSRGWVLRTR